MIGFWDMFIIMAIAITMIIVGSTEMDKNYRIRFVENYKEQMKIDSLIIVLILGFLSLIYFGNFS